MHRLSKFVIASLCGAMALITRAGASYELLMVADGLTDSVHRYDSMTGTYLGSFGSGYMSAPAHITADSTTGRAYVTNFIARNVQTWDYSTGVLLNEWSVSGTPWGITRLATGNLLVGTSTGVKEYTITGTKVRDFLGLYGVGTDGTNIYTAADNQVRKFSPSGLLLGTFSSGTDTIFQFAFRQGTAYGTGGTNSAYFGSFNSVTMSGYGQLPVSNLASGYRIDGIAMGHANFAYLSGRLPLDPTKGVISRYNVAERRGYSSFGSAQLKDPRGIATVIAPEPGTLFALGLGVVCVFRRRRQSTR